MNEIIKNRDARFDFDPALHHEEQRHEDRRKEPCKGYCYISTVGWICRRERIRRKNWDCPQ